MADYTLVAKLTANAKEFVSGFKEAEETVANLQGKVATTGQKFKDLGGRISTIGDGLTKKITKPAFIATGAIVGITSALGFKRLVGLDTAQAKLKGLGYTAEEVETISEQVTSAIDGGMTTMAEGVDVAAGALAAGVDEGKELERYIKLVGDAAVGANRPVDEMAQIFNRVQGQGKLMTQELNMIEMGLPGFAQKMADNVAGGSMEAFREMVTAGEVGTDDFLGVMDDFAGGMADAYAESWSGMAKNTLAYVGIIGETLLDGIFDDSKQALSGFIDVLKSDAVLDWAERTGSAISDAADKVIGAVKGMKQWYDELSPAIQEIAKKTALFGGVGLVALGPILKLVGPLVSGFGALLGAVSFLMSPIGLVVLAVGALAGAFIYAWNTSETFRDFILGAFERIQEVVMMAVEFLGPLLASLWEGATIAFEIFSEVMMIVFETIMEVAGAVFETVMNIVESVAPMFMSVLEMFMAGFEAIKPVVESLLPVVMAVISGIMSIIGPIVGFIGTIISSIIGIIAPIVGFIATIMGSIFKVITPLISVVSSVFGSVSSIAISIFNGIAGFIRGIINTISSIIRGLTGVVSSVFNGMSAIASSVTSAIAGFFSGLFGGIQSGWSALTGFVSSIASGILSSFSTLMDGVKGFINKVTSGINSAIGVINKIPGVKIGKIPQLNSGTDNWGGGFAYMNEGGRGELAMLPGGTQVIPHDVSMKYAKEAGRQQGSQVQAQSSQNVDMSGVVGWLQKIYDKDQSFYVNDEQLAAVTNDAHDRINGTKVSLNERWDR